MEPTVVCSVCRKNLDHEIVRDARRAVAYGDQMKVYQNRKAEVKAKYNPIVRLFKVGCIPKPKPPRPSYRICHVKGVELTTCDDCYLYTSIQGLRSEEFIRARQFVNAQEDASSETETL